MRGLALFDCVADDPATELSFKKGDIIIDLSTSDEEGWFLGRVQNTNDSLKLLPVTYVKKILEKPPPLLPKPKILTAPNTQKIPPQLPEKKLIKPPTSEDKSRENAFMAVKDRLSLFEISSHTRFSSDSYSMEFNKGKAIGKFKNNSAPRVPAKPNWSTIPRKSASISFDPFEPPPLPSRNVSFDTLNIIQGPKTISREDFSFPPPLPPKPSSNTTVSDSSKLSNDLRAIYEKINFESRARYQTLFDRLDQDCKGTIDGKIVRSVWLRSRLDLTILANIWDRLDRDRSGSLSGLTFIIGLYLIDCRLAENHSAF